MFKMWRIAFAWRALLLSSPLLWSSPSFAEDGWLTGSQIEHVFSGNTATTLFTSNGTKALSLFASNHMLITQSSRKGNYPFYNGDWYVSEDSLCVKSISPTVCANIEAAGDHYIGWTEVHGQDTAAFEFRFYQGDTSQLMSGYRAKEKRDWVYVVLIAGITGALIAEDVNGSSRNQSSHRWGHNGECDRFSWRANPFCGPPPGE